MPQTTEQPLPIALPDPAETATVDDFATEESTDGVDWLAEAGELQAGEVEAVEGDVEVLARAPETEPTPAPVTEPVAATPTPTPAPAPAPVPSSLPAEAPASAPTPATVHESQIPAVVAEPTLDMGKWEQEQIANLSKFYAISEEDATALQTEPELVLPKLAANMHMAVQKSMLASMTAMLPQMLQQHTQQLTVEQEAKNAFYTANPDLNQPQYVEAIHKVGAIFRAANPTATKEVAIKTIGDMVRMSLGIQPPAPPAVSAPVATPAPSSTVPTPFTPSRGGGGAAAPIKQPSIWDSLIDD